MSILAQLSDALDSQTWAIVLAVGLGSPAVGCLIGLTRRGGASKRLLLAGIYYVILAGTYGAMFWFGPTVLLGMILLLIVLAGPFTGLFLALAEPDAL